MKKLRNYLYACVLFFGSVPLSGDFAPQSGKGIAAVININTGTGVLATHGRGVFLSDLEGNDFAVIGDGDIEDFNGVYFWSKTGPNTSSLTLYDFVNFLTIPYQLVFTSEDGGTFTVNSATLGTQSGTFDMHYILKPSAVSGVLAVGSPVIHANGDSVEIELEIKSAPTPDGEFTPVDASAESMGNGKVRIQTPKQGQARFYRFEFAE